MLQNDRTPGTETDEPTDGMGMPLSCGRPLCSPGHHHPLCQLSASSSEGIQQRLAEVSQSADQARVGIEQAQARLAQAGLGIGSAIQALQHEGIHPDMREVQESIARAQKALEGIRSNVFLASTATHQLIKKP